MPDGTRHAGSMITPDFDIYSDAFPISSVRPMENSVLVTWDDGFEARFHVISLRENATDEDTTHPVTREQALSLLDVPEDLAAVEARMADDGRLRILWSSGEVSFYHSGWLRAHAPGAPLDDGLPEPFYWDGASKEAPPRIPLDPTDKDRSLEAWCCAIQSYGAAILEGTPANADTIETIPGEIGPVRDTNFGLFFDVISKPDADSNAYTSMELPVHVDLATREYQPGLQFLHAIANEANGGDSILVDAFSLAEKIKAQDIDAFEALTTIPILHRNIAKNTDYRYRFPFFGLDEKGVVNEARWNPWLRAPSNASFEDTDRLYRGLRLAFSMAELPENRKIVRLKAGDLLGFDNRRVLHGRTGYDPETGARHLRGCYIEREELHSRLRIFARDRRRNAQKKSVR